MYLLPHQQIMTLGGALLPALLLVYCTGVCTSQECDVAVVATSQLKNEIRSQLNETITQNLNCNCNCGSDSRPSRCPSSCYDTVERVTDIVKVAINNSMRDLLMDLTNLLVPVVANISENISECLLNTSIDNTSDKIPECGGDGWTQVAFLNMTAPNQTCPGEWSHFQQDSVTACGRKQSTSGSCSSANFSSNKCSYSQVCGRIIAYQVGSPDGAHSSYYTHIPGNEINEPYLDGVSVTQGNPRKHIWSLFGAVYSFNCCLRRAITSISFVDNDYFCDTSNPNSTHWVGANFLNYQLWDGIANCRSNSTCCAPSAGPWFHVYLNSTTTDDIEVRICGDEGTDNEDTPVELLEIYVK